MPWIRRGVQGVVAVHGLGQVHAKTVHMALLHEGGGAAYEDVAYISSNTGVISLDHCSSNRL
jgi:hypothetical protein